MKLQKRFLRAVKKKKYYKYLIQISPRDIKKAGFKEGKKLKAEARKGEIKVKNG